MTESQLAKTLNGRTIGNEVTDSEVQTAKDNGLVIVYSLELQGKMLFKGAVDTSLIPINLSAYRFKNDFNFIDPDEIKRTKAHVRGYNFIIPITFGNHPPDEPYWFYVTNIKHTTFDILDPEELVYCRGIVFNINSMK